MERESSTARCSITIMQWRSAVPFVFVGRFWSFRFDFDMDRGQTHTTEAWAGARIESTLPDDNGHRLNTRFWVLRCVFFLRTSRATFFVRKLRSSRNIANDPRFEDQTRFGVFAHIHFRALIRSLRARRSLTWWVFTMRWQYLEPMK